MLFFYSLLLFEIQIKKEEKKAVVVLVSSLSGWFFLFLLLYFLIFFNKQTNKNKPIQCAPKNPILLKIHKIDNQNKETRTQLVSATEPNTLHAIQSFFFFDLKFLSICVCI